MFLIICSLILHLCQRTHEKHIYDLGVIIVVLRIKGDKRYEKKTLTEKAGGRGRIKEV